tara:strand:+ start:800 stop:1372 length:573 start_codon:yes stop_codon:yes gene_type:complete
MKSIVLSGKKKNLKSDNFKFDTLENNEIKLREKVKNLKIDNSNNLLDNLRVQKNQINYINNIFLGLDFPEKSLILNELKTKLSSYKQQDKKKDYDEESCSLITLDNIIEKLVTSKLKCYYCNKNMMIFFEKVRDEDQWTLDRLNNYDEHSNDNTIICCLKCNLQRRRKNSDKFLFSKQLETNQIIIKKNE